MRLRASNNVLIRDNLVVVGSEIKYIRYVCNIIRIINARISSVGFRSFSNQSLRKSLDILIFF